MIITNPFVPPIDISSCLPACNTVDPPVLDKVGRLCAASKLGTVFGKAEGKGGCVSTGDASDVAPVSPCPVEDCPAGTACLSGGAHRACIAGCP